MSRPKAERVPLPAKVDLIEWVRMRARMSRGRARKVILSGALKVDSHIVGYRQVNTSPDHSIKIPEYLIPAEMASRIQVITPEKLR